MTPALLPRVLEQQKPGKLLVLVCADEVTEQLETQLSGLTQDSVQYETYWLNR